MKQLKVLNEWKWKFVKVSKHYSREQRMHSACFQKLTFKLAGFLPEIFIEIGQSANQKNPKKQ